MILGRFFIDFWSIFDRCIPKFRRACICIFHIHIHSRLTFRILSKINQYILNTHYSLFTTHYSNIKTLFHRNRELWPPKKEKRTVAQPNFSLSDIKTLFHPNRELWPPKKEKQAGSQSQRTLHCYLEKDKPELFPISTKISALLHWKRQDLTVLHPNRELWKQIDRTVINSKLKPLIRHQDTISCQQRTVTTKKKMDCIPTKLFTFRHQDTISSQQRTVTTKKGKTDKLVFS